MMAKNFQVGNINGMCKLRDHGAQDLGLGMSRDLTLIQERTPFEIDRYVVRACLLHTAKQ